MDQQPIPCIRFHFIFGEQLCRTFSIFLELPISSPLRCTTRLPRCRAITRLQLSHCFRYHRHHLLRTEYSRTFSPGTSSHESRGCHRGGGAPRSSRRIGHTRADEGFWNIPFEFSHNFNFHNSVRVQV